MHICGIPNLFHKDKIPEEIPESMKRAVDKLKKNKSKKECLRKAYEIVTDKYRGERIRTYTHLFDIFRNNLERMWNKDGFLHCNKMNYIIRVLLIKSGKFKEDDIELKETNVWVFSLHQYLRVRVGKNKFIDVDPWGSNHGIEFGDHAHGFH